MLHVNHDGQISGEESEILEANFNEAYASCILINPASQPDMYDVKIFREGCDKDSLFPDLSHSSRLPTLQQSPRVKLSRFPILQIVG